MKRIMLILIFLGIILTIVLVSATYYPSGLGSLESFPANIILESPFNITATNIISTANAYIGSGTEWLSIYLSGSVGYFNSTFPITFTTNVSIVGDSFLQLEMNTTAMTCNEASAGAIYYNNNTNKHYGCNVTGWQALY